MPPDTPIYDAFAYLAFLAARTATDPPRHARVQHRLAPPVHDRARRADRRPALGRSLRVRDRRDRGSRRSGSPRELDFSTRGRRVDEAIEVCRRLWSEATVTHHGEFFSFDEVVFEPKPVQQPGPPILVGGESKAALRRAARLGDGWLGMGHTFETAAERDRAALRAARATRSSRRRRLRDRARRRGRVARRRDALGGARRHPAARVAVAAFERGDRRVAPLCRPRFLTRSADSIG